MFRFGLFSIFLPISSSSEVMDLDLSAMAGVLSLLLCWGTGGEKQSVRLRIHLQQHPRGQ